MAPTRRSNSATAPSPLVPPGERKPRRSFFTSSTKLPLALPEVMLKTTTAPRPCAISLAEFAPAPDFIQTSLLPPTTVTVEVASVPTIRPRIKEVVSIRQSRRSVALAAVVGLEKQRAEKEQQEAAGTESATDIILTQPRASRASTRRDSQRPATHQETVVAPSSSPPAPVVGTKLVKAEIEPVATQSSIAKNFLDAGLYCQDAEASPSPFITALLQKKPKGRGKNKAPTTMSFPPLPIEHGVVTFLKRQNDFVLPYNIVRDFEHGRLGSKKVPEKYTKLRGNVFPERPRRTAPEAAVCHCEPASHCRIQCINKAMSYFCGKDCPSGDACVNKSLTKRKGKATKVAYTGLRGFGLVAAEPIKEGDFVIDYRGEVISLNLFYKRIRTEYKDKRNFYALAYDSDEVIDSGMRGNDARFINHGCAPNLDVRKYTTMGDGVEEYEVGFWASRDIEQGEELMYDYNFDSFSTIQRDAKNPDFVAPDEERRTRCNCGAPNCAGYLGKKSSISKSATPIIDDDAMEVDDEEDEVESENSDEMEMDEEEDQVEEAVLEPLKPAARQPRIPIELLQSRNLSNSESLKLSGGLKLPPKFKKSKATRKGIIVKNGVLRHKANESSTIKTRSRMAAAETQVSVISAANANDKLRRTRKNGLLSAAKKAIAQVNDMDVDEAVRVLGMSDKDWETERKRLKKSHEWKARQIALARKLIPELESVSPEKGRQLRKNKEGKEKEVKKVVKESKEKLPRPTPAVLLDPSHCFRPDSWSSIRPQPISPSQTLKSRVSMSALVTTPYRQLSRSVPDQRALSPAKAGSSSKPAVSEPQPSKSNTPKPPARRVTTRQQPARQQPVRTASSNSTDKMATTARSKSTSKAAGAGAKKPADAPKRLMGRRSIADHEAAAKGARVPVIADSASDMMLGKSKVKFVSAANNDFVDVLTGQVRKADPRQIAIFAAAQAEAEQWIREKGLQKKQGPKKLDADKPEARNPESKNPESLKSPLTSVAWTPPTASPRLRFKRPSQQRDDAAAPGPSRLPELRSDPTDYPSLPSATVTLPPSNITELHRDLLHHVETRISKRRSALETERFSQGKGSAWFQSELDNVKEQEYSRAFAFARQQHALSGSQQQLEAMTAEFTRDRSAEASSSPIDLNAFVSPPTPVAGNKRRRGSEFEYQTRKKPGTIRKTEAEWEEERRTRKKGFDWLRVMKNIHGVVPGGSLPVRTYRQVVMSRAEPENGKSDKGKGREDHTPRSYSPTRYAPWTPVSASSSDSSSKRRPHDFGIILSRPDPRPRRDHPLEGDDRWDDDRIPREPISVHYQ